MKKILLSFGLLLPSAHLFAQSTITGANFNPVAGETISFYTQTDTLSTLGPNGNNQTWDYHSLSGNFTIQTNSYITPAGTPKGSYFNADLCLQYYNGGDYY